MSDDCRSVVDGVLDSPACNEIARAMQREAMLQLEHHVHMSKCHSHVGFGGRASGWFPVVVPYTGNISMMLANETRLSSRCYPPGYHPSGHLIYHHMPCIEASGPVSLYWAPAWVPRGYRARRGDPRAEYFLGLTNDRWLTVCLPRGDTPHRGVPSSTGATRCRTTCTWMELELLVRNLIMPHLEHTYQVHRPELSSQSGPSGGLQCSTPPSCTIAI